jgi:hypothetical protein
LFSIADWLCDGQTEGIYVWRDLSVRPSINWPNQQQAFSGETMTSTFPYLRLAIPRRRSRILAFVSTALLTLFALTLAAIVRPAFKAGAMAVNQPGTISNPALQCPVITLPNLAEGAVEVSYRSILFATGHTLPVVFSVSGGSLPPGLALQQETPGVFVLIGTPTQAGTYNFTLRATQSDGCFGERAHAFVVNPPVVTITSADACNGPGSLITVRVTVTNNNAPTLPSDIESLLPPQLRVVPNSCVANVGNCLIVNPTRVLWSGGLTGGQTETISFQAQIADAAPGAQLCLTTRTTDFPSPSRFSTTCLTINCPSAGPGVSLSSASPVSDQKAGSVLVYNVYTSSLDSGRQNTRINLTNTDPSRPTAVHLFFVDGATCAVADSVVCLTQNQTISFLMSDLDPGTTGYIVAVAIDDNGCPRNFNHLIGDEYVKFATGHAANLGAEAISALAGGLPACDENSTTAALTFDGVSYNTVPHTVAADSIPSRADGNDTMLILNRFGGNLGTGAATIGTLFGLLYDDSERSVSFNVTDACQLRFSFSNQTPRTTPRFENFIPAGRTGWAKFYSQGNVGLFGAMINFNPSSDAQASAFNQGHNLHKLTLNTGMTLTIPVFPPNC